MTRDEAATFMRSTVFVGNDIGRCLSKNEIEGWLRFFEQAGIVKFDKAKDAESMFFDIASDWKNCQRLAPDLSIADLMNRLRRAGLKVVEDK